MMRLCFTVLIFLGAMPAMAQCPHLLNETGDNPVCENDSLRIDATLSGSAYQWYKDGAVLPGVNTQYIYVNTAGAYNCIVTQLCGTDSAANTIFVATNNVPVVTIDPDTSAAYCMGDSILLTGSVGGTSQWYLNGAPINDANTNQWYAKAPGVYNMTKTNTKGCVDSAHVSTVVKENNLPVVTLDPDSAVEVCDGDSILLTGSSGGSSQWYLDGVMISGAVANTLYANAAGVYNMTKTNSKGCADSAATGTPVSITAQPVAQFTMSDDTVNLAFSGLVSFTDGSSDAASYLWYFGDGDSAMIANPSHTYDSIGTFAVRLVTTNGMCADTTWDTVTVVNTTGLQAGEGSFPYATMFPNPADGVLKIDMGRTPSSPALLRIYDMTGRQVYAEVLRKPLSVIHVGFLPASVYVAELSGSGGSRTFRLVKQ